MFSGDVYAYEGQGRLVLHNIDPYEFGPGSYEPTSPWSYNIDGQWRFAPSPYGPLWLRLAACLTQLSGERPILAMFMVRALCVLCLVVCGWALVGLLPGGARAAGPSLWLFLCNPLVLIHGISGAHNDVVMLAPLLLGVSLALRHSGKSAAIGVATVLVVAASLVKAPALIALPFLPLAAVGIRNRIRALVTVVVTGVGALLGCSSLLHLGWGWVAVIIGGPAKPSIWSPASAISRIADAEGQGDAASLLLGVLLLVGLVACWVWGAKGGAVSQAIGCALLLVPLATVTMQPWYLLWSLPFLAPVWSRKPHGYAVGGCMLLTFMVMPNGRSWIRPPLYGFPFLLLAVVLLSLRLFYRRAQGQEQLPRPAETAAAAVVATD